MSLKAGPSAVLFDVGNVIVRWNPRTLYAKIFPDPAECDHFLTEVATMVWHTETDRGVSFADNIAGLSARYPHYAGPIAAWRERWDEMFSGAIPETEAAIEALHARGVPLHGLTNMSSESWPDVQAMSPVFKRLQDRRGLRRRETDQARSCHLSHRLRPHGADAAGICCSSTTARRT